MADTQNVERLILVCGATGKQGGAVARSLLDRGFRVRGLTRNPQKPDAQALAEQAPRLCKAIWKSAPLWSGRSKEPTASSPCRPSGRPATIARSSRARRSPMRPRRPVEHLVYSSVGSAHRQTGIPHFESKWEIEQHVRQIGLPYTILRPTYFMQNWEWTREMILGGTLAQPLDPDKPFQQVAVEDVGAFAAIAFENPDRWIGREVDLAGDEQTMPVIADTFGRVIGREVSYYQVPWDQFEEQMGEEFTVQYRWFNDVGYEADIAALQQEYPELTTFERYLRSHGWEGAEVLAGGQKP